jgi:hypothetical protein
MFLVVFVTLCISIIGLFAQVVSLQAAQMSAGQTILAQSIESWHSSAVRTALASPPTNYAAKQPLMGCSMAQVTGSYDQHFNACSGGGSLYGYLPTGYNVGSFTFTSVFFTGASTKYVTTLAWPDSSGNLHFASGTKSPGMGYTASELLKQLKHLPGNILYGTVTASDATSSTLAVAANIGGSTVNFTLPPNLPIGTVALISPAN